MPQPPRVLAPLALLTVLAACGATRVPYVAVPMDDAGAARKLIERTVYEQPDRYVPTHFVLTDEYLELTRGVRSRGTGIGVGVGIGYGVGVGVGTSGGSSRRVTDRVYFDGMGELVIFDDGDQYFVRISYEEGAETLKIYTRTEERARQLADALAFFRDHVRNAPS